MKMLAVAMATCVALSGAANAAVISNMADADGELGIWRTGGFTLMGQTFTLDQANRVNSLTLSVNDWGYAQTFEAQIYAWDDASNNVSGEKLFSMTGATAGIDAFNDLIVNTAGTLLGGGKYVFFLQATSPGGAQFQTVSNADSYAGGALALNFWQLGAEYSEWYTPWYSFRDLAFSLDTSPADVAPVPVPAALPLLGAAIGALGLLRRRRKAA